MFTEQMSNFGLPVGDGYDMSYGQPWSGTAPDAAGHRHDEKRLCLRAV